MELVANQCQGVVMIHQIDDLNPRKWVALVSMNICYVGTEYDVHWPLTRVSALKLLPQLKYDGAGEGEGWIRGGGQRDQ